MDPLTAKLFQDLAIALGLGLLVGLQRQRKANEIAGVRSFALVTVLGTLTAATAMALNSAWIVVVPGVALSTIIFVHGGLRNHSRDPGAGFTTELSLVTMFGVGLFLVVGPRSVGVAVGAMVAVLLQFKPQLHGLARRIGNRDLTAVMKFVLITFVVLPTLPRRIPGLPEGTVFDVVNPYEAWWLVVLIVGINLLGYAAYKVWGVTSGMLLSGFLGGLISSTATMAGNARAARLRPAGARTAAVVVAVASSVVCLRVLFEAAVVGWTQQPAEPSPGATPSLLSALLAPALILFAAALVPALVLWFRLKGGKPEPLSEQNPTQLRAALVFAAAYVVILVALDSAHRYFPTLGPTFVSALSGLTDMDAVTLSTARLVGGGRVTNVEGLRLILIAFLSNLAFKWCLAGTLGGREFLREISPLFAWPAAVCAAMIFAPPPVIELPSFAEPVEAAVARSDSPEAAR